MNSIEILESRIAPASVFTFTDVDGDHVTIKASHGTVTALTAGMGAGAQIELVDLTSADLMGADITISVAKAKTGDGRVNVPRINGGVNNFGKITIAGDLGEIDCGSGGAVAIAKLSTRTIADQAALYATLIGANSGDNVSTIDGTVKALKTAFNIENTTITIGLGGDLGSLTVGGSLETGSAISAHDITKVAVSSAVRGELTAAGNIGAVTIGASLFAGEISAGGNIKAVSIKGGIVGGTTMNTGLVTATGDIGTVSVAQGIIGGSAVSTGEIYAAGNLGTVTVGKDVTGGGAKFSGAIGAGHDITGAVVIKGSLNGMAAAGDHAASIFTGLISGGAAGPITIGKDLHGAGGAVNAGLVDVKGKLASITVGGSFLGGGVGAKPGSILAAGIGSVTIKGSMTGGATLISTDHVGSLTIMHDVNTGAFVDISKGADKVTVGGSLGTDALLDFEMDGPVGSIQVGGGVADSRIIVHSKAASVAIKGGLVKTVGAASGYIYCDGRIDKLTIGGDVNGASITAGGLGTVLVSGNLVGTSENNSATISAGGLGFDKVTIAGKITPGSGMSTARIVG